MSATVPPWHKASELYFNFNLCVCMSVDDCLHKLVPYVCRHSLRPGEATQSPVSGVTGLCEPPEIYARTNIKFSGRA